MSGTVESRKEDGICRITLKNEGKRNAISYPMMDSAIEEINQLENLEENYVLLVTGHGEKAFSAGFDLTQDRDPEKEKWWYELNNTLENYEYPTIAMVNGDAYGGAVELISACDIRVGNKNAQFGITPAKIGTVYRSEAINRVQRLVGPAKTKELLFTGNSIDGSHAYDIGLLNYAVAPKELKEKTYEIAEPIAKNAPISLMRMKDIVATINEKQSITEAEIEWGRILQAKSYETHDYQEGVNAFSENREPEFEGN